MSPIFFVSFSLSSIGDGNTCLNAGYGIKTQSGGARASNRTRVVFAVLFKIYETKLCTAFIYLFNNIYFHIGFNMYMQANYPYLPREGIFFRSPPPHLFGNSSQASYIYLNFWAFQKLAPPRNFRSLLWGKYGYFLELHIID